MWITIRSTSSRTIDCCCSTVSPASSAACSWTRRSAVSSGWSEEALRSMRSRRSSSSARSAAMRASSASRSASEMAPRTARPTARWRCCSSSPITVRRREPSCSRVTPASCRSAATSSSARSSPGSRRKRSISAHTCGSIVSALMDWPGQRPLRLPRSTSCPPQRYQSAPAECEPQ